MRPDGWKELDSGLVVPTSADPPPVKKEMRFPRTFFYRTPSSAKRSTNWTALAALGQLAAAAVAVAAILIALNSQHQQQADALKENARLVSIWSDEDLMRVTISNRSPVTIYYVHVLAEIKLKGQAPSRHFRFAVQNLPPCSQLQVSVGNLWAIVEDVSDSISTVGYGLIFTEPNGTWLLDGRPPRSVDEGYSWNFPEKQEEAQALVNTSIC